MSHSDPTSLAKLDALAGALARWLAGMIGLINFLLEQCDGFRLSARHLMWCERVLRGLIFVRALVQAPALYGEGSRSYFRRAPRGFVRRPSRGSALRLYGRAILPAARGWRARLARLQHVLANLDAFVRRALKRLATGFIGMRTLLVRPPSRTLCSAAPAPLLPCADTS